MKIQLVYPHSNYESKYFVVEPPLGILSIGSYVKQKKPIVQLEILDSGLLSREDIESRIGVSSDIVGISCTLVNYSPHLADIAKQRGARVYLGGHYPSVRAKEILQNQQSVDGVVVGEGELPFLQLIEGVPEKDVANLIYRDRGRISGPNTVFSQSSDDFPFIDWDLIDLKEYTKRSLLKSGLSAPIYSMKGCSWREKTGGCVYCSIYDPKTKVKPPLRFWDEISILSDLGVTHVRDISDDLPSIPWLQEVLTSRPKQMSNKPTFFRYISIRNVDKETSDLLAKLNYKELFIGFESGDDTMLRSARKGSKASRNISAANILSQKNIKVVGCWVLGLEGETEESLERTLKCATEISDFGNLIAYNAPILMPIPGSQAFDKLNIALGKKYDGVDTIDIKLMQEEWVNCFCKVNIQTIKEYQNQISDLSPLELSII